MPNRQRGTHWKENNNMDRRRFLVGVGLCAALAVPVGCGPKEDAAKVEENAPTKEDMEEGMKEIDEGEGDTTTP